MTPDQIKTKVKEAFSGVDSEDFLQQQIKIVIENHKKNYEIFKENNPEKDFIFWKTKNEEININTTNNQEIMAMGIFLLALDEFEKTI